MQGTYRGAILGDDGAGCNQYMMVNALEHTVLFWLQTM